MWEPFGPEHPNGTTRWRSGPNERGTFSILSTCLITLVLCTYTSLHLNIPKHGRERWYNSVLRKTGWLILGVFAPDVVAFQAFRDWLAARRLQHQMNRTLGPSSARRPNAPTTRGGLVDEEAASGTTRDSGESPRHAGADAFTWTRVHSHFALMGGFALNANSIPAEVLPRGRFGHDYFEDKARVSLTPTGLNKIAMHEPGLLCGLSRDAIEDKSKANEFAKVLVCLQATWFLIQIVGCLATSHPISLLELNTAIHALCCLANYVAWWHKPMDIDQPFTMKPTNEILQRHYAWWLIEASPRPSLPYFGPRLRCSTSVPGYPDNYDDTWDEDAGSFELVYAPDSLKPSSVPAQNSSRATHSEGSRDCACAKPSDLSGSIEVLLLSKDRDHVLTLYDGQTLFGFRVRFVHANPYTPGGDSYHLSWTPPNGQGRTWYTELRLKEAELLRLEHEFRVENAAIISDASWSGWLRLNIPTFFALSEQLYSNLGRRIYNAGWLHQLTVTTDHGLLDLGSLLGAGVYGGLHILAWHAPFGTKVFRIMWHISGISVASPLALVLASWPAMLVLHKPSIARLFMWTCGTVATLISPFAVLFYFAARIWLVVGCFINLTSLPDGVFKEPEWSQIIPHLGAG